MYLVAIAWIYVALMMGVAEATHADGTVLGGLITFVLYGLLPVALVLYLLGSPARRKALRAREAAEAAAAAEQPHSHPPDAGGETAAAAVAAERKEA